MYFEGAIFERVSFKKALLRKQFRKWISSDGNFENTYFERLTLKMYF